MAAEYRKFTNALQGWTGQPLKDGSGAPAVQGETAVDGPASRREFWIIRGMLLGVAVILGGLEAYLNTVVFSDLVAVIGCVFSLISVVAVVFSSFLARSRDKGVRRIARVTDAVGIGMSAGVCCVWWYGASSIETAGDRVKEWEDSSALFVAASATANKNYESALDKYNNCRSRPVASLPAEERAGALAACEEIAHSKADFPVSVPDPGPRPTETRATVAAEWKPLIRKLGILGLAIAIGAIGAMGMCVRVAHAAPPSSLEQARTLGKIRQGYPEWPALNRSQRRQSAALATIRLGRMKKWPIRTGEVFGPFLPDWRPVFCHRLVLIEKPFPAPLKMARSLEKGPSVWFTGQKVEVGKGEAVIGTKDEPRDENQDGTAQIGTTSLLVPVENQDEDRDGATLIPEQNQKRKTVYICNGTYKLVPRTDGGWKLQTGTPARDVCRVTGTEGEQIISSFQDDQAKVLQKILRAKGKLFLVRTAAGK